MEGRGFQRGNNNYVSAKKYHKINAKSKTNLTLFQAKKNKVGGEGFQEGVNNVVSRGFGEEKANAKTPVVTLRTLYNNSKYLKTSKNTLIHFSLI